MANIQKLVGEYLDTHPSIKDCMKKDLVNYSKLSRQISADLGLRKFDAVLVACRRYSSKLDRSSVDEDRIKGLLDKSKVRVKDKIVAVVLERNRSMEVLKF